MGGSAPDAVRTFDFVRDKIFRSASVWDRVCPSRQVRVGYGKVGHSNFPAGMRVRERLVLVEHELRSFFGVLCVEALSFVGQRVLAVEHATSITT